MSNKTIAKFAAFVICIAAAASLEAACGTASPHSTSKPAPGTLGEATVVGTIANGDISESSGIAVSACQSDVLWTHNDSGDGPFIFAINAAGKKLGTWHVAGAENVDWEDIALAKDASGNCSIYIGEIGNNKLERHEHIIYRVPEPHVIPEAAASNTKKPLGTAPAEVLRFTYPDTEHDAETLMVRSSSGDIYIVTKQISGPAGVYKLRPVFAADVQKAVHVADVSVPAIPNGLITGGDISLDGRRAVLCDYTQAYEYTLPQGDVNFDDIWRQEPAVVDLGRRQQGESIAYSPDGTSIYATSEGANSPVIRAERQK